MTIEQAKEELVKRYKYLYENASFILAPYMHKETQNELKARNETFGSNHTTPIIYLNLKFYNRIVAIFEEFLLSDIKMEESYLYKMVEKNKNNKEYLEKVKIGLALLSKNNEDEKYFKLKLDLYKILGKVRDYLEEQSGDLKNKEKKMSVLDEYYRILRYQNNGKIYTSGRNLNLHDCDSLIISLHEHIPSRLSTDIGVGRNKFIDAICNAHHHTDNHSVFTEGEKQEVYLQYHDELPYDLMIKCCLEEEYIKTIIDSRLVRPENTQACFEYFSVNEQEIFINPDDKLYRYYQLCPHCGYIVNIPKEILSDGIKKRIETRCMMDSKLFRKMYLYSELFSLDKKSIDSQRRVLKRN